MHVALREALTMGSSPPRLSAAGADALVLSQLASASPSMDLTMLLQLQELYQQMAVMEALMATPTANGGFYPGAVRFGGLGALGTAAYLAGAGHGGPRVVPVRLGSAAGSIARVSRPVPRIVPVNRSQPQLPFPRPH
jgi:hypothetical protein